MSKAESADLILKLYDLRREATMREGRKWFITFMPESAQDVLAAMVDDASSAYYRMVISYWDMAAGFVNHGAIDEEMFLDSSGEAVLVFSKLEPFIGEIRTIIGNDKFLKNLEALVMRIPNAKELLASRREMIKRMMQARAEAAETAKG
jgi:hypothetical protein